MRRPAIIRKAARAIADMIVGKPAAPGMCGHCCKQPICDDARRAELDLCEECLRIIAW